MTLGTQIDYLPNSDSCRNLTIESFVIVPLSETLMIWLKQCLAEHKWFDCGLLEIEQQFLLCSCLYWRHRFFWRAAMEWFSE